MSVVALFFVFFVVAFPLFLFVFSVVVVVAAPN
jgi:hypothetical protein